jgi:hypothetical protein
MFQTQDRSRSRGPVHSRGTVRPLDRRPSPRRQLQLGVQNVVQTPPLVATRAGLVLPVVAVPVAWCAGACDHLHRAKCLNRSRRDVRPRRAVQRASLGAHAHPPSFLIGRPPSSKATGTPNARPYRLDIQAKPLQRPHDKGPPSKLVLQQRMLPKAATFDAKHQPIPCNRLATLHNAVPRRASLFKHCKAAAVGDRIFGHGRCP